MDRSLSQEEVNKTKSIDIQTSNYQDDSNIQCFDDDENNQDMLDNQDFNQNQNNQIEQLDQKQNDQNLNGAVNEVLIATTQEENKEQQKQNTNKGSNYKVSSLKLNQIQKQPNQQDSSPYNISDRKIWAVQGVMPGSVSKKFIRSYKLGRYNKIKSLKIDMEYFNSPHHEQLHLGNNILPFQNNKNRLFTTGSFDYSKYLYSPSEAQIQANKTQQQFAQQTISSRVNSGSNNNNINKFQNSLKSVRTIRNNSFKQQTEDFNQVFSPRTTSQTVIQQVNSQQSQHQQSNKQIPQQVNMEIRYIDIIQQPIVKQSNFINNKKCPHGMTNMRANEKKNIFFFNQQSSNKNITHNNIQPQQLLKQSSHTTVQQPENQFSQTQYKMDQAYLENADTMYDTLNKKQLKGNDFFGQESSFGIPSSHQLDGGLHKQNLRLNPQNIITHSEYKVQQHQQNDHFSSQFSTTSHRNFLTRKSEKSVSKSQPNNQLRLPSFATNPDNISFFSKAKQNLVKYVNQIGTQDHPLRNTFVAQKQMF